MKITRVKIALSGRSFDVPLNFPSAKQNNKTNPELTDVEDSVENKVNTQDNVRNIKFSSRVLM